MNSGFCRIAGTALLMTVLALPACSDQTEPAKPGPDATARDSTSIELERIVESYFEEFLKLYPISATAIGDPRYDTRLPTT